MVTSIALILNFSISLISGHPDFLVISFSGVWPSPLCKSLISVTQTLMNDFRYSNMTNFTKSLNCAASRLAHLRVSQNFACRIHTTNRCMKNYYRTLGLEYNATDHQIKQAYKKLAVKYSPNRNRTERGAAIFQEVTEAYKVLGNEKNRQEYDSRLSMRLKIFLANPIAAISRRVNINADENEERRKINDKEKIENEAVSKYFLVVGPFFAFLLILKYYGY